ncbi:MAG: exodeoxyribonuclease III [Bacteroidetes bacterium]|jgi:exodeoxyribonuclease III|nr:exodeoxyribonuclease III [Bacteroidota bacterium]
MRIVSFNVNGVRASVGKGLLETIKEVNADMFCIQETKAQNDQVMKAMENLEGYHVYANSAEKKGYSGVAIFSKNEPIQVTVDMGVKKHDTEGRIIAAEYEDFILVNVYVPNSGAGLKRLEYRSTWDKAFAKYLKELQSEKPIIVTGDFNVAHQAIDLKNDKSNYNKTSGYTQIEIDGLDRILKTGLLDMYRSLYPEEVKYTFWSQRFNARKTNAGWRIDYFLASKSLKERITDCQIHNDIFGSDHCPISLDLV